MRTRLVIFGLLATLALQPALAGGWGSREERRPPPQRMERPPPRPPPRMDEPRPEPRQMPPPNYGPRMSGPQAAQRAQQLNGGGRVLAVDPAQSGYRVRV